MDLGINLAGAQDANPSDLATAFPTDADIDYYAAKGFSQIRLPISWELLQPQLNGTLDSTYLGLIQNVVTYAASRGMSVLIDMHNYGAYNGALVGSAQVPDSAFANVWGQIAQQFAGQSNVVYDLMNEPQQATASDWLPAVNAAIGAIRDAGAAQQVLVSGIGWDGGQSFTTNGNSAVLGAPGAIVDPLNNYAFEVHQYMDDTSGQNDWVVSPTIGADRLEAVTAWARAAGVKLYLGEFGVADNGASLTALTNMLNFVQANQDVWEGAAYFAGGNLPSDYIYSVEPQLGLLDKAQMAILEQYGDAKTTLKALGNGTIEADTYVAGSDTPSMVDILDSNNQIISRTEYDPDGNIERLIAKNADGSITITTYQDPSTQVVALARSASTQSAVGATDAKIAKVDTYNAAQQLVSETVWAADGTSVKTVVNPASQATTHVYNYAADGSLTSTVDYNATENVVTQYASGKASLVQHFNLAWALTSQDTFNAAGVLVTHQASNADGHITVDQYNASTGFIASAAQYSASWVLTSWAGFDSKGVQQTVTTYDAAGKIATIEQDKADGTHTLSTYTDAVQTVAQKVDLYSAQGALVSSTTLDASGKVATVDAIGADGSKSVSTYTDAVQNVAQTVDLYTASNVMVSRSTLDASGKTAFLDTINADGTHTVQGFDPATQKLTELDTYTSGWTLMSRTNYDAAGDIAKIQLDNTDGTHTIKTYTDANQAAPQTIDQYSSAWSMVSRTTLDASGNVAFVDTVGADGGHTIQAYDPTTHKMTSVETLSSAWALLTQTKYDAAGDIASIQKDNADGSYTMALYTDANQTSPQTVNSYDAHGNLVSAVTSVVSSLAPSTPTVSTSEASYMAAAGVTGITLTGSAQTVTANALGDTITSNDTGNHLIGGAGADTFIVGRGGDVVTGGAGADTFVFNSTPTAGAHITDYTAGQDTIDLTGLLAQNHYTGSDPVGAGYLKITADGLGDSQIWSDTPGSAWQLVATLAGVAPASLHVHGDLIFG